MSTSRRNASGRGPGSSSSGARRPRVAGLRNRSTQESDEESATPAETTPAETTPAETTPAETTTAGPFADGPEEQDDPVADGAEAPADTDEPASASDEVAQPYTAGRSDEAGESASDEQEGTPVDATAESGAAESEAAASGTGGERPARKLTRRPAGLIAVMLVLTVGFGGLAFWFHSEAYSLRNEGPAANQALVDQAATSKVKGQITAAVETLFSYDFANTAKTKDAAKKLLTGQAVKQYDKLFDTVRKQAPKQKLVLTTTVRAAGVTQLQGDRAEVLLFVDQNATRTDTGQSNIGPAQLTVSAEKHGDQWKISGITPR